MDLKLMLNDDAGAAKSAPRRSASMISENDQLSPQISHGNIPTRSMSLYSITNDLTPPSASQPYPPAAEAPSLKRSSPSSNTDDQHQESKRARISQSRSPVLQRKRERAMTPEYAKRMPPGSKKFSTVKADLTVHTNGQKRNAPEPQRLSNPGPAVDQRDDSSLEPNVSGIPAYSSILRQVMDMLFDNVVKQADFPEINGIRCKFEIEAKLGKILDRRTGARLELPVRTDAVLEPFLRNNTMFEPALSKMQFARLNKYLNDMTNRAKQPGRSKIEFTHPKQVDRFSKLTREGFAALPVEARALHNAKHDLKLRVSTDRETGAVTDRLAKIKVGDLEIYCPGNAFDIRISVNLECNFSEGYEAAGYAVVDTGDPEEARPRDKDRLSYRHQATSIDLTLVKNPRAEETFEIEVELNADALLVEGRKVMQGYENDYEKLVGQMVENALVLSRAAVDEANKPDASQVRQ